MVGAAEGGYAGRRPEDSCVNFSSGKLDGGKYYENRTKKHERRRSTIILWYDRVLQTTLLLTTTTFVQY